MKHCAWCLRVLALFLLLLLPVSGVTAGDASGTALVAAADQPKEEDKGILGDPVKAIIEIIREIGKDIITRNAQELVMFDKFQKFCEQGPVALEESYKMSLKELPQLQEKIIALDRDRTDLGLTLRERKNEEMFAGNAISVGKKMRQEQFQQNAKEMLRLSNNQKYLKELLSGQVPEAYTTTTLFADRFVVTTTKAPTTTTKAEGSFVQIQERLELSKMLSNESWVKEIVETPQHSHRKMLVAFLQHRHRGDGPSDKEIAAKQIQLHGMLKKMLAEVDVDLETVTKKEHLAEVVFTKMLRAKTKELRSIQWSIQEKQERNAAQMQQAAMFTQERENLQMVVDESVILVERLHEWCNERKLIHGSLQMKIKGEVASLKNREGFFLSAEHLTVKKDEDEDEDEDEEEGGNQTSSNRTSGNQTSGNQTSGNQTSGNQTSGNQTNQTGGNESLLQEAETGDEVVVTFAQLQMVKRHEHGHKKQTHGDKGKKQKKKTKKKEHHSQAVREKAFVQSTLKLAGKKQSHGRKRENENEEEEHENPFDDDADLPILKVTLKLVDNAIKVIRQAEADDIKTLKECKEKEGQKKDEDEELEAEVENKDAAAKDLKQEETQMKEEVLGSQKAMKRLDWVVETCTALRKEEHEFLSNGIAQGVADVDTLFAAQTEIRMFLAHGGELNFKNPPAIKKPELDKVPQKKAVSTAAEGVQPWEGEDFDENDDNGKPEDAEKPVKIGLLRGKNKKKYNEAPKRTFESEIRDLINSIKEVVYEIKGVEDKDQKSYEKVLIVAQNSRRQDSRTLTTFFGAAATVSSAAKDMQIREALLKKQEAFAAKILKAIAPDCGRLKNMRDKTAKERAQQITKLEAKRTELGLALQ
eukprot:TRINITY_DN2162_c0_g1_i2.p1 TRINITY_DN2162_c0_g1~~TRINITY_DN2162_c0_g1_i2.p1  ORF type:complete len:869 (-),score=261.10 TRINITY_DN2162_c0_g1_i2:96-2702(-)